MNKKTLPLSEVDEDSIVKIVSLNGGQNFKEKLICQGIVPGQSAKVVNSGKSNRPCLLKINDSKIAIGCGMLNSIIVEIE